MFASECQKCSSAYQNCCYTDWTLRHCWRAESWKNKSMKVVEIHSSLLFCLPNKMCTFKDTTFPTSKSQLRHVIANGKSSGSSLYFLITEDAAVSACSHHGRLSFFLFQIITLALGKPQQPSGHNYSFVIIVHLSPGVYFDVQCHLIFLRVVRPQIFQMLALDCKQAIVKKPFS